MKNKIIPILFILLLTCIVSGCGKSEAVKNVESLISEIGDVTLESEESIRTADDAYKALTDEEKGQVKNKTELQDKKNELVNLKLKETEEKEKQADEQKKKLFEIFEGKWKQLYKQIYSLDGMETHQISTYYYDDFRNEITISYEHQTNVEVVDETHIRIDKFDYELINDNGVQKLRSTAEYIPMVYVREEDYKNVSDQMFVHITLDDDNIDDYFGGVEKVGQFDNTDAFGEERETDPADAYMITSKAYMDKDLLMLAYQDVTYEVYFDGVSSPGTFTEPYIITTATGTPSINHYGRAKGDIWYVKKEYVSKIEDCEDPNERKITFSDGFYWVFPVNSPFMSKLGFSVADLEY